MESVGRLLYKEMDDGQKRLAVEIGDDQVLMLPLEYNPSEFALAGNLERLADGQVYAAYDASTCTGAIWCAVPFPVWTLVQPCLREYFFNGLVPLFIADVQRRLASQ